MSPEITRLPLLTCSAFCFVMLAHSIHRLAHSLCSLQHGRVEILYHIHAENALNGNFANSFIQDVLTINWAIVRNTFVGIFAHPHLLEMSKFLFLALFKASLITIDHFRKERILNQNEPP